MSMDNRERHLKYTIDLDDPYWREWYDRDDPYRRDRDGFSEADRRLENFYAAGL